MAKFPRDWVARGLTTLGRQVAAVELRDGAEVLVRVPVERGKPRGALAELAACHAEHEQDVRAIAIVLVSSDGDDLCRRVVRGSAQGRDASSPSGLLAQVMRHNERLASELGRQQGAVLDALVAENRRLSLAAADAERARAKAVELSEQLQSMAQDRELTMSEHMADMKRRDDALGELKKVFPQVKAHLAAKAENGSVRNGLRRLVASIATKAPDKLDAMLDELSPEERQGFERIVGSPEDVARVVTEAEKPRGNGHAKS